MEVLSSVLRQGSFHRYICVAGDWLQGPYVYALYDAYGFSRARLVCVTKTRCL